MRVTAGRSFSAVTNFVVGLFMEILAFLFDIFILKTPKPTIKGLKGECCFIILLLLKLSPEVTNVPTQ